MLTEWGCRLCSEQGVKRCPYCGLWYCYEHRDVAEKDNCFKNIVPDGGMTLGRKLALGLLK